MTEVRTGTNGSAPTPWVLIGARWSIFIMAVLFIGIALLWIQLPFLDQISPLITKVKADNLHILVSIFLLGACANQVLSYWLSLGLTRLFKLEAWAKPQNLYPPAVIGLMESAMYPICFLLEKPEYIGGWIALKVAGGWKRWQGDDSHNQEKADEPRRRFYKFLVGNVFTVAVAFVTYGIIYSLLWEK